MTTSRALFGYLLIALCVGGTMAIWDWVARGVT